MLQAGSDAVHIAIHRNLNSAIKATQRRKKLFIFQTASYFEYSLVQSEIIYFISKEGDVLEWI
jgi:tRNA(Leu) C34 or U34 (ribose-2'-O)-methylase TrmL